MSSRWIGEPTRPRDEDRAVRTALDRLAIQVRWEVADLIGRRGADLAWDLVRGRAAELADSGLARDHLLAMMLKPPL